MSSIVHVLFVDDQWCQPEERSSILATFGALQRRDPPIQFHYETAEEAPGEFAVEPVLRHLRTLPDPKIVILDIMFGAPGSRLGLDILETIRSGWPVMPVIMMTSLEGELQTIERAMELGANEYIVKKPTVEELEEVVRIYSLPATGPAECAIWGNSNAIRQVRAVIARVAFGGTATILITGESGTGKELVARAIHRQGPRRSKPFVDKNCAFETSDLLDSDLFGHERGAFTGAERRHVGRLERANHGVLFLDEIGSMPLELQGKLLRVLETREFQRVGGSETVRTDFQLVCATNADPAQMVERGQLREDLFYRICQFPIYVPPLRERIEDISTLAELFLNRFRHGPGASYLAERLSEDALHRLTLYQWPGNVRELRNIVERAAILCRETVVGPETLPPELRKPDVSTKAVPPIQSVNEGLPEPISLSSDPAEWPRQRILAELHLILAAKRRVRAYKGRRWQAELMRLLYPECKAQSSKALEDLVRRLSQGPWGISKIREDKELREALEELLS